MRFDRLIPVAALMSLNLAPGFVFADEQATQAVGLLEHARQIQNVTAENGVPFALNGQLTFRSGSKAVEGWYKLVWKSPIEWREDLDLGGIHRTRVGAEGGYRQIRGGDYQPLAFFDFDRMASPYALLNLGTHERLEKVKEQKIQGARLSCVETVDKSERARELCFDAANGVLVHAKAFGMAIDYSQFATLQGKSIPLRAKLDSKLCTMELSLQLVNKPWHAAPDLFTIGDAAEFWGLCDNPTDAEIVDRVAPNYPANVRAAHRGGIVFVYVVIEKDGSVSHVRVAQGVFPALDREAADAVSRWRYRPRTCDGIPIRTETIIEIIFSVS